MKQLEVERGPALTALSGIAISIVFLYFLWNWLVPQLFGLPAITFWQAIGLRLLAGCIFHDAEVPMRLAQIQNILRFWASSKHGVTVDMKGIGHEED